MASIHGRQRSFRWRPRAPFAWARNGRASWGDDSTIMAMHPMTSPTPYAVRSISAEALLQELRSNVPLTILDVRDRPQICATGTIEGARAIPLYQLVARTAELVHLRATPIVVVSQRAHRARAAALDLEAAGFGEVFVLDDGIQRWLDLDYPVEERRGSAPSSRP